MEPTVPSCEKVSSSSGPSRMESYHQQTQRTLLSGAPAALRSLMFKQNLPRCSPKLGQNLSLFNLVHQPSFSYFLGIHPTTHSHWMNPALAETRLALGWVGRPWAVALPELSATEKSEGVGRMTLTEKGVSFFRKCHKMMMFFVRKMGRFFRRMGGSTSMTRLARSVSGSIDKWRWRNLWIAKSPTELQISSQQNSNVPSISYNRYHLVIEEFAMV